MGNYPDLAYGTTPDAIDDLIAALNAAMGDALTFERDVLDVDRREDWGAVELTNVINEYADGRIIDQVYLIDIWAGVSDRESGWLQRIEAVLAGYGDRLSYTLHERAYLHDLKKVLWRWKGELWSLAGEPVIPEPEEDPEENPEEDPEDGDD